MKNLKILIVLALVLNATDINAQLIEKLGKKAKASAERTLERKVEEKTEQQTEKAVDSIFNAPKKVNNQRKKNKKEKESEAETMSSSNEPSEGMSIQTANVFFPNGQILFAEDFSADALGDFPAQWETNSGGEIISINGMKALKLNPNGTYVAKHGKLPENYALEFDLITENLDYKGLAGSHFGLIFSGESTLNKPKNGGKFGFSLWKGSNICNQINVENWGKNNGKIDNTIPFNLQEKLNGKIHFTIVVNKNRLRVFIQDEKAIDLPSFLSNSFGNFIQFYLKGTDTKQNHLVALSNIIITEEGEDIRSKILKGGFSTNQILFDSGSDQLKRDSFEMLQKIGKVLQDDASLRILIIGHTDSDGDEVKNMTLSKARAFAVMNYFIDEMGIDKKRLQSQGRGENEPIASNVTADGKAQNRRVEFKPL